jgi:glycerol-3-phosphate acyltransferase PlsY
MLATVAITIVVGYLIGSIPGAYLIGRAVADVDVRTEGEGNVGARNVFHVVGSRWGIVVFLADFAKGAVVAAIFLGRPTWQLALAGAAVFIGHAYPVWLGFIGGKGLSTIAGFATVLMPLAVLFGAAAAGVVWLATRRFLPSTVTAIVVAIVGAPLVGVSVATVGIVLGVFVLAGVKRALDESRMRAIEARTGWDRTRGLRT